MIYVLRLLHIVSGAFWFGAVLFTVRFLMPSIIAAGPSGGAVMVELNKRRMSQAFLGAGFVNVASGIWLLFIVSGGALGTFMQTGMGRTLGIGGGLAILALLVGTIMGPPAAMRLGAIAATVAKRGGPPLPEEAAEIARIQKRMGVGTAVAAALMTLALCAMAVARYM